MREFAMVPLYTCKLVEQSTLLYNTQLSCAEAAKELFHNLLKDEPSEVMLEAYVDGCNKLIGVEVVSRGGIHGSALTPRDLLRGAFLMNASAVIIGHNHPSGDPTLSEADHQMAKAVSAAFNMVGIMFLDSIVVTREGKFSSWLEEG